MNIVIWAAGIGSGMWPLANEKMPEQFIKILKNENNEYESMFQRVYRQITQIYSKDKIYIVINKGYEKIIKKQVGKVKHLIVEPLFQNKNLSMINAALYFKENNANICQESFIFMSVDFYADMDFYENIKKIARAIEKEKSSMAILGIKKDKYNRKYRYVYEKNSNIIKFINYVNFCDLRKVSEEKGFINADVIGMNLYYFLNIIENKFNIHSLKQLHDSWQDIFDIDLSSLYLGKLKQKIRLIKFSGNWESISKWGDLIEYMDNELFDNKKAYKIMQSNISSIKGTVSIDVSDNAVINISKYGITYISYT